MLQAFPGASGVGKLEPHLLATIFMPAICFGSKGCVFKNRIVFFWKKSLQINIKSGAFYASTSKEKQSVNKDRALSNQICEILSTENFAYVLS